MERLRRQFDTLHKVDLSSVEDIHTVAGLLKLYLRLLPQQLVPFSVYRLLLGAFSNSRTFHERQKACRFVYLFHNLDYRFYHFIYLPIFSLVYIGIFMV